MRNFCKILAQVHCKAAKYNPLIREQQVDNDKRQ